MGLSTFEPERTAGATRERDNAVPGPQMRSYKKVVLSCLVTFVVATIPYGANASQTVRGAERGAREWVAEADLIVHGKIVAVNPYWNEGSGGRTIYSKIVVDVIDLIKGKFSDSVLTFEVIGGTIHDTTVEVSNSPSYRQQTERILFLRHTPHGVEPLTWSGTEVRDAKVYAGRGDVPVDVFIRYLRLLDSVPGQKVTWDSFLQTQPKSALRLPVPVGGGQLPVGAAFPHVQKQDTQVETDTGKTTAPTPAGGGQVPRTETEGVVKEGVLPTPSQNPVSLGGGQLPAGAVPSGMQKQEIQVGTDTGKSTAPTPAGGGQVPRTETQGVLKKGGGDYLSRGSPLILTAKVFDAWWTNEDDYDGDGYVRSAWLNWDPDVDGGFGSLSVFEKIYYKEWDSGTWSLFATTSVHTITGTSTDDAQYVGITSGHHTWWDWKIEVYRNGQGSPDDTRDPSNDVDLNDKPMEWAEEDLLATIFNAWWTDEVDNDGDGYVRSAWLNWDPDVVGGGGSLNVLEKIYYKEWDRGTWSLLATTSAHTITGVNSGDAQYWAIASGHHTLWDWKIEVYRSGQGSPDYTQDPLNDGDLNDKPMESALEDVLLTATIYNAWWSNEVDNDGDGYVQSAWLNWDPDVFGGGGSLSVFEKIYYKQSSSGTWSWFATTSVHTITGTSTQDAQYSGITSGIHALWDWKIEVYRSGQGSPDYTRDPSNDVDLNDKPMEWASEDLIPVITNISPMHQSAGTGAAVTITGINFGASQGTGKVEFFYRSGGVPAYPKIPAPILLWTNTLIACDVPVATILDYPASTSSGPVTVTNSSGATSNGFDYSVSFGYGQNRWAGSSPRPRYRINENTADCVGERDAVIAAANTWNATCTGIELTYVGGHNHTNFELGNDTNEIMWGVLAGDVAVTRRLFAGNVVLECDMVLNDDFTWSTASTPPPGQFDVQSVVLHELGHWLQLRDLYGDIGDGQNDIAKVMYGVASAGATKRVLHADDIAGINWIYGPAACCCPCHANPACADTVVSVQDVVATVAVAFRGGAEVTDPSCPRSRTDVNCDDVTSVQDVVAVVSVAFRGGNPGIQFCNPCSVMPA